MTTSIAIIILLGLIAGYFFEKLRLPGLLGMLFLGICIGPYLHEKLITISADLRQLALIIILLRAGLGISKTNLKKVGKIAVKMSFIPGIFEGITISIVAMYLFDMPFVEAGILGFIIAAVSPAVVVPSMLDFMNRRIGTEKNIPTLILASASIDDVFAITIYTAFLGLQVGTTDNIAMQLMHIPISILLGIGLGALIGLLLNYLFNKYDIIDTKKVLLVLALAILLTTLERELIDMIPVASLLGVMTIGFVLLEKNTVVAKKLAGQYHKIWVLAEIILFVLIGAQVNIHVAFESGLKGLLLLGIGLIARTLGVLISTAGSQLNWKERLFCAIAYMPKATVQAAIGAVPLSLGVPHGELILAMAVLAIIITAPLGLIGIRLGGRYLLNNTNNKK